MKTGTAPLKDEKGQGLVEYALILLLVAASAVVALAAMGGQVDTLFTTVINAWP
jgi:pilus assembly protein Flp/PilA